MLFITFHRLQPWEYKSRPGGKVQQMHPKEQNDAVNCFDLKKEKDLSSCSFALASNIC